MLAVIAILAAIITPRVFAALDDANLTAEVMSIKSVRSATEDYYRRYGRIGGVGGAPITTWNNRACEYWDRNVLIAEQFLEKPFATKLGTDSYIRVIQANTNSSGGLGSKANPLGKDNYGSLGSQFANNGAYDLTREYAALDAADRDEELCAREPAPSRRPTFGFASVRTELSGGPVAALGGLGSRFSPLPRLSGTARIVSGLAAMALPATSHFLDLIQNCGLRPLQGIVLFPPQKSIPGGTTPPSPGEGSQPPGGDVSHPAGDVPSTPAPCVNDAASGAYVVEVVLRGVSIQDAYRLSLAIDGPTQSNWAYWDSQGRVKYDFDSASSGDVYIYVADK